MRLMPGPWDEQAFRTRLFARWWAASFAFLLVTLATYGYVSPEAQVFGHVAWRGETTEKVVALSFDDGPNEPYTSAVLDVLARYQVKATFFEIGRNVARYPEVTRRLVAEGHVLGNHSYAHDANHALGDSRADYMQAEATYLAVCGVRPTLVRPPHNKKTPWELAYLEELDLTPVAWSVGTAEGVGADSRRAAQDILNKVRPGSIIALHDGWGTSHTDPRAAKTLPAQALPLIIETLQQQGYAFVTIPALLGLPAYK